MILHSDLIYQLLPVLRFDHQRDLVGYLICQFLPVLQGSLKASLASIQELRTQQAEEMREVENYVEHIRSLSDEREALTLEFEAENEQLKAEIVRLTNTLDGRCSLIGQFLTSDPCHHGRWSLIGQFVSHQTLAIMVGGH